MTTTLEPETAEISGTESRTAASRQLRTTMAATHVSFAWLGVRKTLTTAQKDQAANPFGAEGKFLSAGKKLLDTSHPAFKAVTAVKGETIRFWKGLSLPYPEPGIHLIRQMDLERFDQRVHELKRELDDAVVELDCHYDELRRAARQRLGDLFNASDYPPTLTGEFAIEHEFPSVEPPDYLRQLNPELYTQEYQRVQAKFTEAVELAEGMFLEELARLVEHLTERLTGADDGQPKVFRDSAVTNLTEFFQRFQTLNVGSNPELDELVDEARAILGNVDARQLRERHTVRREIATGLGNVQHALDDLLLARPRRNILRPPRANGD